MSARPRIGELLVNLGLLSREQLESALEHQRTQGTGGRRLGALLVDLGFISEVQLTKVLSNQLSVPWVSLHHIDFSRQLLNLVPKEIAEEFCVIPIYVRHERKVGDTLYLAMEDPTHDDAVRRVMAACGMPVKSMIAAPSDIRGAIRAFYGGAPPETASSPAKSVPAPPPVAPPPPPKPAAAPPPPPPSSAAAKKPPPPPQAAAKTAAPDAPKEPAETPAPTASAPSPEVSQPTTTDTVQDVKPAQNAPTAVEVAPPPNTQDTIRGTGTERANEIASTTKETDRAVARGATESLPSDSGFEIGTAHDTVPPTEEPAHEAAAERQRAPDANAIPKAPRTPSLPAMPTPLSTVSEERSTARVKRPMRAPEPSATGRKQGPRMLALTLLDGTTIQIPAQRRRADVSEPEAEEPAGHEQKLTTRDLIAALRAVANGADADDALGDARWETIVAALLAVLLRKQLISDWEFVEELNRVTQGQH